jgi:hypothetical protein
LFPAHIASVHDAYFWVQGWCEGLGGELDPDPWDLDILIGLDGNESGLRLRPCSIRIGANTLRMGFVFGAELEPAYYRFDFRPAGSGTVTWRYDMHRGHEDEDGTLEHWHFTKFGQESREPVAETPSFEDIARLVAMTP